MYRKFYFNILLTTALLFAGIIGAAAQTQPVRGEVKLKKADGTMVPVADAVVEAYRTDAGKGTMPTAKTDKKGQFSFVGFPIAQIFAITVSGPGIGPRVEPGVKAGRENIVIVVTEGDGRRLTEAEVREVANTPSNAAATGQPTEESKKAEAERLKLIAEYEGKKKKVESENATIARALEEGNSAFNAKNYDLALVKYDEGIAAVPDFAGSTPVFLNNKGVILKIRAVDNYNKAVKITDAAARGTAMASVKSDLEIALDGFVRSWNLLKNVPKAEIVNQAGHDKALYDALNGLTDTYRLMVVTKTNVAKAAESKTAFDAYFAVEPDAAVKAKAQTVFGDVMLESGDSEAALAAYRTVLTASPENPDALAGAGLSLVNLGYLSDDKVKFQEAADMLQKFVKIAPATHKYKGDAEGLLDTLKAEQKVTPKKKG